MAKVKKLFSGYDTYGRMVERALSESGKWFARYYDYNGYGKSWCKWYEDEPHYITETENKYSGEIIKHDPVVAWGWNKMTESDANNRYRLPA